MTLRERILHKLRARPMTTRELGAEVGVDLTVVNEVMRALFMAGVVDREPVEGWSPQSAKQSKYLWRLSP